VGDLREAWMNSMQLMGNERGQVRALQGVGQWQIQFFRGNGWTNAQSTGDVADAFIGGAVKAAGPDAVVGLRDHELPPEGVRLILTLEPASGLTGTVMREVPVAPQMM
jgi:general secretion pathway protein J